MASMAIVAAELAGLFTLYRQPCPDKQGAEFQMLALDWQDTLSDVSDAELLAALKSVKRRQRFFPVPADVCTAVEEMRRHPANDLAALPPATRTPDEQRELNLAWARRIRDRQRGKGPQLPDWRPAVAEMTEQAGVNDDRIYA